MRFVSCVALAILGSVAAADPSRSDRQVKYVYQISAQGSHTPKKSFNLATRKNEEPSSSNYVTPLGIRQQYMIGDELRLRYVEEQKSQFLADKYDITQIFIQTSWNDTTILSAQAMLLGLYPPGKNNYKLRDDQKERAVPPIEGFDFKPWIAEMGDDALPYGTTIFPIQMNGYSYDYTLALDDGNCAKRKSVREQNRAQLDQSVAAIVANSTIPDQMKSKYFTANQWEDFCDYINWAWLESVDLTSGGDASTRALCQQLSKERANFHADLESKISGVTTHDLRNHMAAQVKKWIDKFSEPTKSSLKDSQLVATSSEKRAKSGKKVNLEGTAGTENPNYIMFWTNEQLLEMIANSLAKDDINSQKLLPFSPSSTVLLEFTKETKNLVSTDLYVQLYVNDQPVKTALCGGQTKCTATSFADALEKTVADIEVATFCKA